jgi:hypothetical protein
MKIKPYKKNCNHYVDCPVKGKMRINGPERGCVPGHIDFDSTCEYYSGRDNDAETIEGQTVNCSAPNEYLMDPLFEEGAND